MSRPLMPKATAVWLVDNTSLTFDQVADFCALHVLEVKGIADGDVAQGIKGMDPVSNGQLSRKEIERCQQDPRTRLVFLKSKYDVPEQKPRKGPRYTPLSRRQDRPDATAWLLRNHPELTDAQVGKLVGTTKPTIQSIRDRSHWNSSNIKPVDPVTLSLCSQVELDAAVQKAADRVAKERKKAGLPPLEQANTLRSAEETTGYAAIAGSTIVEEISSDPFANMQAAPEKEEEQHYDAASVFSNLKGDSKKDDDA